MVRTAEAIRQMSRPKLVYRCNLQRLQMVYDLILIDIALPKMNGIELNYKIRKIDKKVKICFLTAGEMEEIRE
jgi:two-component SAPR family response regulator